MIKINFKNLEKSEMAKEVVYDRITPLLDKFPELKMDTISFTLSMDNSPIQAGPDLFKVKIQINSGQYKGVRLERSAKNLYLALASIIEKIHERLKRHDEKLRQRQRSIQRKKKTKIINHIDVVEEQILYS